MAVIEPSPVNRMRVTDWHAEGSAETVGRLRREAVAELRRWGVGEDLIDCAALVAGELLSNAWRHGGAADEGLHLSVRQYACVGVRVEVRDHTRRVPCVVDRDLEGESGRGMVLVSRMPGLWGVADRDDGKIVFWEHRSA